MVEYQMAIDMLHINALSYSTTSIHVQNVLTMDILPQTTAYTKVISNNVFRQVLRVQVGQLQILPSWWLPEPWIADEIVLEHAVWKERRVGVSKLEQLLWQSLLNTNDNSKLPHSICHYKNVVSKSMTARKSFLAHLQEDIQFNDSFSQCLSKVVDGVINCILFSIETKNPIIILS